MNTCLSCGSKLKIKSYKYCSNKCQKRHIYTEFIKKWLEESRLGKNFITSTNISHHIRRYLIEKFNEKCSQCGWSEKHIITGVVPLEVDHIDGIASNNIESNLRILCLNCHSLTSNYRNLNKGKGRRGRVLHI